jgi:hypothetical protein
MANLKRLQTKARELARSGKFHGDPIGLRRTRLHSYTNCSYGEGDPARSEVCVRS